VWPPKSFSFCDNGRTRRLSYYLTFNRLQEALCKDVERLYGVLTARFHILLHPGRFGSVEQMVLAGKAAAISHDIVVGQRRGGFVGQEGMAVAAAARDG